MTISYLLADSFLVETTSSPDYLSLAGLEQAFLLVRERLRSFASDPAFSSKLALAFGGSFDGQAAQGLALAWQNGDFSAIPTIEVISRSVLNGVNGAYSADKEAIYLAHEYLQQVNKIETLAGLILEEYGHYADGVLNGSHDSDGDEGAIFSVLVLGESLSTTELAKLKAEDDHRVISLNRVNIVVERQNFTGDGILSTVQDWTFLGGFMGDYRSIYLEQRT